jgi:hypothetical protein
MRTPLVPKRTSADNPDVDHCIRGSIASRTRLGKSAARGRLGRWEAGLCVRSILAIALVAVGAGVSAGQSGTSPGTLNGAGGWWQKPQVVLNDGITSLNDLGTVNAWGWPAYPDFDPVSTRKMVDNIHRLGRRYVMSLVLISTSWATQQARPELANGSLAVIDINGNRLGNDWGSDPGQRLWWFNTNLPGWQNYLIDRVKDVVDFGADGIIIDAPGGTAPAIDVGGSFGPEDMALFRAYLAERYTLDELKSMLGVTSLDLATFDYGNYIRSSPQAAQWKANLYLAPLHNEYMEMEMVETNRFLMRLAGIAREYARTKYGRYFTFSVNMWAMGAIFLQHTPFVDYYTLEFPFSEFGYAPADSPIAELKLARGIGNRPGWVLPGTFTVADWYDRVAANHPVDNLMKIYTSQAYAADGAFWAPGDLFGHHASGTVELRIDTGPLRPFYSTAREFTAFLENRGSLATVALLHSQSTERNRWSGHRNSYLGTADALLNAHVLYDVVPLGYFGVPESPGPAALAKYRAAYLPSTACLSQTQVDDILAWVSGGGTLVVFGEFATCNVLGNAASFPVLDPYRQPGTHVRGSGRIVTLAPVTVAGQTVDAGTAYRGNRSLENLFRVITPLQAVDQPMSVDGPTGLNVLADTSMAGGALVLHLVNSNWNSATDAVPPVASATVRCTLPAALQAVTDLQAYRVSPDRAAPERVSFQRDGSSVTVTSTNIKFWDLVIFTTDARARAFANGPVGQFTTLLATLTAKSRDVSAFLPTRDAIAAATASGNHLLAERLAYAALPAMNQANRYRVLFTEAHREWVTLSPERYARECNGCPNMVLSTAMAPALASEFSIERSESPLTPALLAPYDALMVASPDRVPAFPNDYGDTLSPSEVQAVQQFVSAGRGLMVLGECNIDESVNKLLAGTGVSFAVTSATPPWKRTACVYQQNTSPVIADFTITDITAHDATRDFPSFFTTWGTALTVASPAVGLARTAAITYADAVVWPPETQQQFNAGEPVGPLPVIAVSTLGPGRVYVWSDNSIGDAAFTYMNMTAMMRSALRWIVKSPAGNGLDVTPPAITVTTPADHSSTSAPTATLTGIASDASGIASVSWSTDAGASGMATGTTAWTTGAVPLHVGDNVVTVTAADTAGNMFGASLTITRGVAVGYTGGTLASMGTTIRAIHIVELRQVIDELRVRYGLTRYAWTDPTLVPGATPPKRVHVEELRTALVEAYTSAGRPAPSFSDAALQPGVTPMRASHLTEVRSAVAALW